MASTIKLKNGSGAPLASDLVQGEPALDLTNKRLYTEDSLGAVIEVGTNPTSLTTGDITATGTTTITTADINGGAIDGTVIGGTTTAAGSFTTLQADTSLNVDGTVTADGLTVDNTDATITLTGSRGTGDTHTIATAGANSQNLNISADDSIFLRTADTINRIGIFAGGDISFYEDTGNTAKFFWDASAEKATIGNIVISENGDSIYSEAGPLYLKTVDASSMFLRTNNTNRMILDASGNVGIGVTPDSWGGILSKALQVGNVSIAPNSGSVSAGYFGTNWYYDGTNFKYKASNYAGLYAQETGAHKFFTAPSGTAGNNITFTQAMTLDASGNLLVGKTATGGGTTTGTQLNSDGYTQIVRDSASTSPTLYLGKLTNDGEIVRFTKDGSTVGSIGANSGNMYITSVDVGLLFNSGGNQILPAASTDISDATKDLGSSSARFKDLYLSGGVYAGVTTGSYGAKITAQSTTSYVLESRRTGTGSEGHIVFQNGNGAVGSIFTNASATSYNTSSDYRLKTDVQSMIGATERLKALKPVNFEWISNGERVDGFLAHEAQEVVPEAVTGTKDAMRTEEYEITPAVLDDDGNVVTEAVMGTREVPDYQGIDQSKLVPLLTGALQEAIARIETLEAEVATLKGN